MKLSCIIVLGLVFTFGCFGDKSLMNYIKIIKVDFKVQGRWCLEPFCSVRHVSRYQSFLDIGCNKTGTPMTKLFAFGAKNFRQFIQLNKLDICNLSEDISKFPFMLDELKTINKTFPGILHECPYPPFKLYNVTYGAGWNQVDEVKTYPLPNGIYRHHLVLSDDLTLPTNRVNITIYSEYRVHSSNFRVNI